ncbi:MAG: type III pantothenate kinase [Armatimonadota bacterium]|nr:MAG: type III pantothenate kinase [Armatimonadota bacterium]
MTALLAVDVGNSETKLGLLEQERPRTELHFPTGAHEPSESIADLVARAPVRPAAAAMCSVVPAATEMWQIALRDAVGAEAFVVEGDTDVGMRNCYAEPATLGPDRLVGALAARELYGAPVIVVSLGTATVINVVSRTGEFLGGAIAPGVETSLAALEEKAARLLPVRFEAAPRVIASDTRSAMTAGAFFGVLGQVKELLARARAELGEPAPAVLTGGRAELIARELDNIAGVEPALNLIGLRLAWAYHEEAASRTE